MPGTRDYSHAGLTRKSDVFQGNLPLGVEEMILSNQMSNIPRFQWDTYNKGV